MREANASRPELEKVGRHQTEAAHILGLESYCAANGVLYRRSEESSGSAARVSARVFRRCSFYANDKKLKKAVYNAVILLSRTLSRFR